LESGYTFAHRGLVKRLAIVCLSLMGAGCASTPEVPASAPGLHPLRFLLTFDDGPSLWQPFNPTTVILETLARNSVQPGIKAVFFVQTRNPKGGGTERGRELLRRTHHDGHVLAVHSGSARGHINHRSMPDAELNQSLSDARADIRAITGRDPTLVRPPFWAYDTRTRAAYAASGLDMLLTDLSARDGKIYGWTASLRRRSHFRAELTEVRRRMDQDRLPVVDGMVPVVVTFHDTNAYTANHMDEYLNILIEEAGHAGLRVAAMPFYDDAEAIERVARLRAETEVHDRLSHRPHVWTVPTF
jgi:peptidoglycan/xylan/chitin deacetylase (PgdA/CDA1 family)